MFGKQKRTGLSTIGRPRIDVSMLLVRDVMEGHYFLHAGQMGTAFGGYEFDVFGDTDGGFTRDSDEMKVPGLRMHLKIGSPHESDQLNDDIIGWGTIHDEYVEAGLTLHRDFVRDILFELRRTTKRELRIAGHEMKERRFAIDMFMMSTPSEE